MRHLRRNRIALAFWILGLIACYLLTPIGPRDGWQPAEDESVLGFANEGRSVLTWKRAIRKDDPTMPILVKDARTGRGQSQIGESGRRFKFHGFFPAAGMLLIENNRLFGGTDAVLLDRESVPDVATDLRCIDLATGKDRFTFRITEAKLDGDINWTTSRDGTSTAFLVFSKAEGRCRLEWRDLRSGDLILERFASAGRIALSPDGRYLAFVQKDTVEIWERATRQRVALIPDAILVPSYSGGFRSENYNMHQYGPEQFSNDSRLLLMHDETIWNWNISDKRYSPNRNGTKHMASWANPTILTPDSKSLIRVRMREMESYLEHREVHLDFLDCASASPIRTANFTPPSVYAGIGYPSIDQKVLAIAMQRHLGSDPNALDGWLGRIPFLGHRANGPRVIHTNILLDPTTLEELGRVDGSIDELSTESRLILTHCGDNFKTCQIWDFPPRKPLRWLLPALAAWTAAFWGCVFSLRFLAARRRRKRLAKG